MRLRPSRTPNTRLTLGHGRPSIRPVKISDSKREHYEIRISLDTENGKTSEHLITVRAYDRYDNVGVAKTIIPAQAQ